MIKRKAIDKYRRFGRWVTQEDRSSNSILCRCDCGTEKRVDARTLLQGRTKSCGCSIADRVRKHGDANSINGIKMAPEYAAWSAMIARCYRKTLPAYKYYGARGITVCDSWRHSYLDFRADMGPRPANMTLERQDNSGGYWCGHCPDCTSYGRVSNCIWAPRSAQVVNRRSNVQITFNGETMCRIEWARRIGINPMTFAKRIRNWDIERAINTPVLTAYRREHPGPKKL
jgi:hypothetical protein